MLTELILVLSLGSFPSLITNLVDLLSGRRPYTQVGSMGTAAEIPVVARAVAFIAFVLFVAWNDGDLPMLGLRFRARVDVPLAVALLSVWVATFAFRLVQHHGGPFRHVSATVLVLGLVGIAARAIYEEMSYRCYMIPRLTELIGNRWTAWGISSFLFGLCHLYEGGEGAFHALIYGGVLGLVFLFTKRGVVGMIVHTSTNGLLFLWSCGYLRPH